MSRITTAVIALAFGIAVFAASSSARAARFHGDVAGVATGPGHHFFVGDGLYLRFRDTYRSYTPYKVCYSRGRGTACFRRTTGAVARTSRIFFAPPGVGNYTARWYVRGGQVASWTWFNDVGD